MGKTRGLSTKYHLSCLKFDNFFNAEKDSLEEYESDLVKLITENDTSDVNNSQENRSMDIEDDTNSRNDNIEYWKGVTDNLFKNIDNDWKHLETSLEQHESSLMSFSKCIKRSLAQSENIMQLKKVEKRKLRQELFVKGK